jgi:hypothetical protein
VATSRGWPSHSQQPASLMPGNGGSASGGNVRPWSTSTMLPRATEMSAM